MDDVWRRIVENITDRVSGPLKFRFLLQPMRKFGADDVVDVATLQEGENEMGNFSMGKTIDITPDADNKVLDNLGRWIDTL